MTARNWRMADELRRVRPTRTAKTTVKAPKVTVQEIHRSETTRHRRRRKKIRLVDEEEDAIPGQKYQSGDDHKTNSGSVRHGRKSSASVQRRRHSSPGPGLDISDSRRPSHEKVRSSRYIPRPRHEERRKSQPAMQTPRISR